MSDTHPNSASFSGSDSGSRLLLDAVDIGDTTGVGGGAAGVATCVAALAVTAFLRMIHLSKQDIAIG